jgi:hypothetical protein
LVIRRLQARRMGHTDNGGRPGKTELPAGSGLPEGEGSKTDA